MSYRPLYSRVHKETRVLSESVLAVDILEALPSASLTLPLARIVSGYASNIVSVYLCGDAAGYWYEWRGSLMRGTMSSDGCSFDLNPAAGRVINLNKGWERDKHQWDIKHPLPRSAHPQSGNHHPDSDARFCASARNLLSAVENGQAGSSEESCGSFCDEVGLNSANKYLSRSNNGLPSSVKEPVSAFRLTDCEPPLFKDYVWESPSSHVARHHFVFYLYQSMRRLVAAELRAVVNVACPFLKYCWRDKDGEYLKLFRKDWDVVSD